MTDPFDFEPRLEARLTAHAARASRPFDAAAIAAAAAATRTGFVGGRSWVRPLTGRDGRLSTLRLAFALVLLAVAVTAGAVLVGSALRGRMPLPDHLAIVPAPPSADPVAPTSSAAPRPSTLPSADPSTAPASQQPSFRSDLLALVRHGPKHCGEIVTTIAVDTGAIRDPGGCFNYAPISPDGSRAIIGGGTNIVDPADPGNWLESGDRNRFDVVGLRDGTSEFLGVDDVAGMAVWWSPNGRWIYRWDGQTFRIRSSAPPMADGSEWVQLPKLAGTAGLSWSPDESRIGFQTADGYVIGDGDGTNRHVVDGIPWILSWSSDGSRIAFPHTGAYDEVWVGNSDGTDQAKVSDRGGTVELSPDGRRIAILEDGHLLRWRLADGTWHEVDLRVNLDTREPRIEWAPAGDVLIVSARNDPDGNGGPGTTFLVSIDGTILAHVDGSDPTWSPDSSRFAVSVSPGDLDPHGTTAPIPTKARGIVYLVSRDGTTVQVKDAYSPAWSPDGSFLAVFTGDPVSSGVAVLAADGTGRHAIPKVAFSGPGSLTWVP